MPKIKRTEKCKGAIAWTFGMKEEEYNLKIETRNMDKEKICLKCKESLKNNKSRYWCDNCGAELERKKNNVPV